MTERTDITEAVAEALVKQGVFKGQHGLVGLLESQDFWDRQPYCTRLYYGDGAADYLHRGVLRSAVELLAERQPQGRTDTERLEWLNEIRATIVCKRARNAVAIMAQTDRGLLSVEGPTISKAADFAYEAYAAMDAEGEQ